MTSVRPQLVQPPPMLLHESHQGSVRSSVSARTHSKLSGSSEPLIPDRVIAQLHPTPYIQSQNSHSHSMQGSCSHGLQKIHSARKPVFHRVSRSVPRANCLWVPFLGSLSPGAREMPRGLENLTDLRGCPTTHQISQPDSKSWEIQIIPSGKIWPHA